MISRPLLPMGWWATIMGAFVVLTLTLAATNGTDVARLPYLWAMFVLCTGPFAFVRSINGRHVILVVFLLVYFIYLALGDLLALLGPPTVASDTAGMAEFAIVLGGVMFTLGYCVVAGRRKIGKRILDWSPLISFWLGLVFWASGLAATLYWQLVIQKNSFELNTVSPVIAMSVTLGRMLQPLGMVILAYRLMTRWSRLMLTFVVALLGVEFVVGFISDSKELAIRGIAIVLMAAILLRGKIPKIPLIVAGIVVVIAFPIFQAYRLQVLGYGGHSRAQAAGNLMENLSLAIQSVLKPSMYETHQGPGLAGRVSLKGNIVVILERVGHTAPYQHGYTYMLFLDGMVPRVFWPDKPDSSVGQLFNRELKLSEFRDVYISPSYLGEAYWNFGWSGIVGVMFGLGALMGFIGKRFSLSEGRSLTRFLVIVTTMYSFALRLEGGIALEALVWARGLVVLALLHWIFAHRRSIPVNELQSSDSASEMLPEPQLPDLIDEKIAEWRN
jgi:hypothetical protein